VCLCCVCVSQTIAEYFKIDFLNRRIDSNAQKIGCLENSRSLSRVVTVRMGKKKSTVWIWICQFLFIAMFSFASYVTLAEGWHQRKAQRESTSSPERIKVALIWTASLLFIAMAPLIVRFFHALVTDPAVPLIWNEGKARGRRFLNKHLNKAAFIDDHEQEEKKTK
jgi:hypothetical protein